MKWVGTYPYWLLRRAMRLLLVLLLLVNAFWWGSQAAPVFVASFSPVETFYGNVHHARQSSLLKRVSLRINEDDSATFMLWMNPANRREFERWFGPDLPMRFLVQHAWGKQWVLVSLDCAYGTLEPRSLLYWRLGVAGVGTLCAWLSLVFALWLVKSRTARRIDS